MVAAHSFRALRNDLVAAAHAARTHVDIGGEGRYESALNVNPFTLTSTTGEPLRPIPNLVRGTGERLPIASQSIELLTLENAPIRSGAADELARVLRPGGDVFLRNPTEYAVDAHRAVIDAIPGAAVRQATNGHELLTHIRA